MYSLLTTHCNYELLQKMEVKANVMNVPKKWSGKCTKIPYMNILLYMKPGCIYAYVPNKSLIGCTGGGGAVARGRK